MPKILLVNDDGIDAPGLKHLWNGLKDFGDVVIVAPKVEQSGAGMGISIRKPVTLERVEWPNDVEAWRVGGSPAVCVKLALSEVLDSPPDIIVSGINSGPNSGRNCLYSGTIGGVIEGIFRGIPGVAFSCADIHNPNYAIAEPHITPIVQHVLDHPLPKGTLLNITIPSTPARGYKLARQGSGYWIEVVEKDKRPESDIYYMNGKNFEVEEHPDSDIAFINEGFLTGVPLHVNELTDHAHRKERQESFEGLFG
ncbi:MAG: 5'/3'-nucleotidase SurE [Waddliaceae bacterium]|nr:5'/3'-nucleotidase SurE [Waddliaceae bacterium]